ncbi:YceD family protein [Bacillaceae bacterium S4-13-56]
MLFPLQKIRAANGNSIEINETVDLSEVKKADMDIREISPVKVTGTVNKRGDEITFLLHIEGKMILPCSRTLVDVPYPFSKDFVEVFSTSPYIQEGNEEEIHPVRGEVLDLKPFIKENVLLEVPLKVVADDAEEQNSPREGKGWEFIEEEQSSQKIDPRLAKLQGFFDDETE